MERRKAIQTIAVATAATIFLPACSGKRAVDQLKAGKLKLNNDYLTYLAKISQSILPVHGVSDKISNPVSYIMTMLNDCTTPEEIAVFASGFDQFMSRLNAARMDLTGSGSEEIAQYIAATYEKESPPADLLNFIELVKKLSIENLLTSEYYMTKYLDYRLVPEPYIPCQKLEDHG